MKKKRQRLLPSGEASAVFIREDEKNMSRPVSRVLLKTTIYLDLPLPAGSSHLLRTAGPAMRPPTVLLRIEFTASTGLHAMGELLPHLSTISCMKAGSLFLLHLSEGHPWRALPVILALWSPDFPHAQAFALCPRSFSLLILLYFTHFLFTSQSFCGIIN